MGREPTKSGKPCCRAIKLSKHVTAGITVLTIEKDLKRADNVIKSSNLHFDFPHWIPALNSISNIIFNFCPACIRTQFLSFVLAQVPKQFLFLVIAGFQHNFATVLTCIPTQFL